MASPDKTPHYIELREAFKELRAALVASSDKPPGGAA